MAAILPDLETSYKEEINPKNDLPTKITNTSVSCLERPIKQALDIMDRQDAIKSYTWHNLPGGLTGELIERILYESYIIKGKVSSSIRKQLATQRKD